MKIGKNQTGHGRPAANGHSSRNPYFELAADHARAHGTAFIIRALDGQDGSFATGEPATEPQWIAWVRYWQDLGIPHAFALQKGLATVPCEWPEDFDASAPPSDRLALLPRRTRRNPESRARMIDNFCRLSRQIGAAIEHMDMNAPPKSASTPPKPASTDFSKLTPSEAEQHLAELSRQLQGSPVSLSEAALRHSG
jgi:hypothetical protein